VTVTATGGGVTHTTSVSLTIPQTNIFGITPPDSVVIVIEENHSFSSIIGSSSAPFINSLAQQGALFTQSFAVEHPSQPNYLDLFSGSNQGITDDSCPHTFSTLNLASELAAAGLTFTGFSEDLPSAGSTVCTSGAYARKHAPWVNFTNVPTSANQPFTSFPTDFTTLPTISIIDPNLNNDMHDGTIAQGDTWLQLHLNGYVQFAQTHNSLLIVTWDEDDSTSGNQVATIFVGPMVKQGQFAETINHFNVLRTLEDLYGLTHAGSAATAATISDVWKSATPDFTVSASPASLTLTQGSTGTTTISTTVSGGFNSPISLSVSGLPTGVTASFNPASIAAPGSGSSTLTFSAASTATTGTTNVTVNANGGGVTHAATIALTVSASGGGSTTTQILSNPGFENGSSNPSPWTVTTTQSTNRVINNTNAEPPHSGTWDAWLDGHGSTTTDSIMQQVSIPSNATSAILGFWLHVDTAETTTTTAYDTLTVQVRNTSGTVLSTPATFSNLNHAVGYQQQTMDLTSFKGQTIQIFLQGKEDYALQTSFVVDDFALNVTTPGADTVPPTTSITSPSSGATVSGTVVVNATASDNVGVTQLQILIDGSVVASNANSTSLSFNFNTTSLPNGSHTILSKAFDAAGNVGTSSTVTVTVSNSGGTVTELLGNGGFENGASNPAPWLLTSTHSPLAIINSSSSEPPHSGTFDAWMNGWGTTTTDTVMQQVTVPANATAATFSFWLHIDTAETTTTTTYDTLQVQIRNSSGAVLQTLATFSNLNHAAGYQQHTFNLNSLIGQTVQIFFLGKEDNTLQTSFVLDDVSLKMTQ